LPKKEELRQGNNTLPESIRRKEMKEKEIEAWQEFL